MTWAEIPTKSLEEPDLWYTPCYHCKTQWTFKEFLQNESKKIFFLNTPRVSSSTWSLQMHTILLLSILILYSSFLHLEMIEVYIDPKEKSRLSSPPWKSVAAPCAELGLGLGVLLLCDGLKLLGHARHHGLPRTGGAQWPSTTLLRAGASLAARVGGSWLGLVCCGVDVGVVLVLMWCWCWDSKYNLFEEVCWFEVFRGNVVDVCKKV